MKCYRKNTCSLIVRRNESHICELFIRKYGEIICCQRISRRSTYNDIFDNFQAQAWTGFKNGVANCVSSFSYGCHALYG